MYKIKNMYKIAIYKNGRKYLQENKRIYKMKEFTKDEIMYKE